MKLRLNTTILKQFSLTTISSIIFSVIQILIQVYIVRSVAQDDYGIFAFTIAIYNMFELMATGYSSDFSMQNIGKTSSECKLSELGRLFSDLIKHDLKVYTITVVICCIVGLFLIPLKNFNIEYWIILLFSLIFQTGYSAIKNTLISYNLIKEQTYYEIQSMFLMLILNVLFTYFFGILGYVISMALYSLMKNIIGLFILHKLNLTMTNIFINLKSKTSVSNDGTFALYSIIRNSLTNFYNQLDIILIGVIFSNPSVIANYKVAKTLSGLPSKVVYPIWSALRGRMVQAYYKGEFLRLRMLVLKPMIYIFISFLIIFFGSYFLSPYFIPKIYGVEYGSAITLFLILLLGTLILQLSNNWFNFWVIIANQNKPFIIIILIQIFIIFITLLIFDLRESIIRFTSCIAFSYIVGGILQQAYFYRYKYLN